MTDIIGIDPGLVSGCVHVRWSPVDRDLSVISSGEYDMRGSGAWLDTCLGSEVESVQDTVVVVERFTITRDTARNTQAPWSLMVIGQSQWIVWQHDPSRVDPLVLQSPADAKTAMPGTRLREFGLWHRGGKGHANDAFRHVGLYLLRSRTLTSP